MIYLPEKLFDRYWKKMTGLSVLKGLLTTEAPINLANLQKLYQPLKNFDYAKSSSHFWLELVVLGICI